MKDDEHASQMLATLLGVQEPFSIFEFVQPQFNFIGVQAKGMSSPMFVR